ncbi:MAG: hypothetical protein HFI10_07400 [Lachnospiraceae bacterium]|jgi:hypothetical protein|nr:hypothetical protein [Lachnospiraceae bacterium]
MSGIFDENRMMQAFKRYLPAGETVLAGIHGIGLESEIREVFGTCFYDEEGGRIIPDENGGLLEVKKSKYSKWDVYIGVTAHSLILAECEVYRHLYEFDNNPDMRGAAVREIDTCVRLEDIGNCFSFEEIGNCVIKNAWMGAVNCTVTLKNGGVIKLQLPKRGGIGNGMPHHAEYREKILAALGSLNGGY